MLQTAEGALEEVNRTLINARQLAISSANEAVNDESMMAANQQEFEDTLHTIDRIASIANYGKKPFWTAAWEQTALRQEIIWNLSVRQKNTVFPCGRLSSGNQGSSHTFIRKGHSAIDAGNHRCR